MARAYGVDEKTIRRHGAHRTAQQTAKAIRPTPASEAPTEPQAAEADLPLGDVDGRIRQLARTADRLRAAAEAPGSTLRERGTALGEARRTVESMGALATARDKGREIQILQSPEWAEARKAVVAELGAVPGGLEALVRAEAAFP